LQVASIASKQGVGQSFGTKKARREAVTQKINLFYWRKKLRSYLRKRALLCPAAGCFCINLWAENPCREHGCGFIPQCKSTQVEGDIKQDPMQRDMQGLGHREHHLSHA
jgi:hypothetical protein